MTADPPAPSVPRYRTIVADPPWEYEEGFVGYNRTPGKWSRKVYTPLKFPSMTLEEIAALPVKKLAASDCNLFLWTTQRYLPDTFEIASGWGFRYRQTLIWHKSSASPLSGSVSPHDAEFLLVCRRGSAKWQGRLASSVIPGPQQKQNSRKPELFLDLIESISPGPYLELFARRNRFGWDTWGNESLETVELSA